MFPQLQKLGLHRTMQERCLLACFCATTSTNSWALFSFRLFLVSLLLLRVVACPLILFGVGGNQGSGCAAHEQQQQQQQATATGTGRASMSIALLRVQATSLPRILLEESQQAKLWQLRRRKLRRRCPTARCPHPFSSHFERKNWGCRTVDRFKNPDSQGERLQLLDKLSTQILHRLLRTFYVCH